MTTAPHVYQAVSNVMSIMAKEGISKDRKNQQQGYNFRGIDDVYAALGNVLSDNKLVILPRVIGKEREERQTQKGGMLMYTILTVEFDLVSAVDGSQHTICMIGEAMDSADKSSNKSQSAALKYACLQAFMIPTEGQDNDTETVTHDVAPKQKTSPNKNETPFDDPNWSASDLIMLDAISVCETPEHLSEWSADHGNAASLSDNAERIRRAWKDRLDAINAPKPKKGVGNPLGAG